MFAMGSLTPCAFRKISREGDREDRSIDETVYGATRRRVVKRLDVENLSILVSALGVTCIGQSFDTVEAESGEFSIESLAGCSRDCVPVPGDSVNLSDWTIGASIGTSSLTVGESPHSRSLLFERELDRGSPDAHETSARPICGKYV